VKLDQSYQLLELTLLQVRSVAPPIGIPSTLSIGSREVGSRFTVKSTRKMTITTNVTVPRMDV
jgi:hypothetical protein